MIRLARVGATKQPHYRVVVIEKDRARNGRSIEVVGTYNPRSTPAHVDLKRERIDYWTKNGAQLSDRVTKLMAKPVEETTPGYVQAEQAKAAEAKALEMQAAKAKAAEEKAAAAEAKAAADKAAEAKAAEEKAAEAQAAEAKPAEAEPAATSAEEPAATTSAEPAATEPAV